MAAPHRQAAPACATQNSVERNAQLQNLRFGLVKHMHFLESDAAELVLRIEKPEP